MPTGDAEYVLSGRIGLSPDDPELRLETTTVETTPSRRAPEPRTDGWRLFRTLCAAR